MVDSSKPSEATVNVDSLTLFSDAPISQPVPATPDKKLIDKLGLSIDIDSTTAVNNDKNQAESVIFFEDLMNEAEASKVNNTQLPSASYLRPTISSSIKKDISLGCISERKSKQI